MFLGFPVQHLSSNTGGNEQIFKNTKTKHKSETKQGHCKKSPLIPRLEIYLEEGLKVATNGQGCQAVKEAKPALCALRLLSD